MQFKLRPTPILSSAASALTNMYLWFLMVVVGIVAGCLISIVDAISLWFSSPPSSSPRA